MGYYEQNLIWKYTDDIGKVYVRKGYSKQFQKILKKHKITPAATYFDKTGSIVGYDYNFKIDLKKDIQLAIKQDKPIKQKKDKKQAK